jgi:hypothetical protein
VVSRFMTPTKPVIYSIEVLFAAGVIFAGRYWLKRDPAKQAQLGPSRE